MNVLLWVLQVLLAVVFIAHGLMLLMPPPDIAAQMFDEPSRWFWVFLQAWPKLPRRWASRFLG